MNDPRWIREIPQKEGDYFVATRQNVLAGIKTVFRGQDGRFRCTTAYAWDGWWWNEPIVWPNAPTEAF